MKIFRYFLPATDLIFGKGTLEYVGTETKRWGNRALVVTGRKSMEKLGFLQKVIDYLRERDLEVTHYGRVEPNPTVEIVNEGAEKALSNRCDVIVGLGGGSAMDTAKNIAVVAGHSKNGKVSIWEFAGVHKNPRQITPKTLPVVAITSTSGTGSHVSRFAVVTNPENNQKTGILSPLIFPKVSIVDLDVVSKMPPPLTARTGFDVMAHVMECFVSRKANPITDLYCLKAMELVSRYLLQAYRDGKNLPAREAMALADTSGGWALTTSRPVLPHALSHPVSAYYPEIDHGVALAALTPEIMRFNIQKGDEETVNKYCLAAKAMGKGVGSFNKKEALKSVEAIEQLLEKIELNIGLKDLDVEEEKFEGMTESAFATMTGPIEANPVWVTKEDILELYRRTM